MSQVLFSNDIRQLVSDLVEELRTISSSDIVAARILVPDHLFRAFLSHALSDHGISLLRLEILTLSEELDRTERPFLSRFHLLPKILSFLEKEISSKSVRLRKAKQLLLPFARMAFLNDERALITLPSGIDLWHRFSSFVQSTPTKTKDPYPLFVFGFSSLHPETLHRLQERSSLRQLYLLSPCMLFWGDQPNDHEARRMLNREPLSRPSAEQLEQFLNDRHRLLANCGQIGREFSKVIEDSSFTTSSHYVLPEQLIKDPYQEYILPESIACAPTNTPSLQNHVQADLLLMISERPTPYPLPLDHSIEIHAAPTPLREIEALYHFLSQKEHLEPASVVILATDLQKYSAAIEQVFGGKIPFQVWGEHNPKGPIKAFFMIRNVLSSKCGKEEWIQLLRHPVFQKALSLQPDEALDVIDWLTHSNLDWGITKDHRKRYLAERNIPLGTMEHSHCSDEQARILTALLTADSSEGLPPISLLPAIGIFFHCASSLLAWWPLPLDPFSFASMDSIITLIQNIVSLIGEGEDGFEIEALRASLGTLSAISKESNSPEIPCAEVFSLFDRLVSEDLSRRTLMLKAPIIVAEFGAVQPIPADCIAIVGADCTALPKGNQNRVLDRLDCMVSSLPYGNTYLDRSTFLEALLAAKTLFLSYQNYSFETREKVLPSPMITDLLSHLDAHYLVNDTLPSSRLHIEHSLHRTISRSHSEAKSQPLFRQVECVDEPVDVNEIVWATKSPLRFYFKEQFGLSTSQKTKETIFKMPWEEHEEMLTSLKIPLSRYNVHLLPTVQNHHAIDSHLFSPSSMLIGTFPDLIKEGIVLFRKQWKQELFHRWPECSVRHFCTDFHKIAFPLHAIIIEEDRTIALANPPPLDLWADFTKMAKTTPLPFSYDIASLLISGCTPEDFMKAVQEEVEQEFSPGPWSAFSQSLTLEQCEKDLQNLISLASSLWSGFFASVEGA